MHFHSHFADKLPRNAASINQHMDIMMTKMIMKGLLTPKRSTMFEVTDGCGKHYRCRNIFMYLTALARKYMIIIHRAVDAPGHGKGIVDGVQGVKRSFLGERNVWSIKIVTTQTTRWLRQHNFPVKIRLLEPKSVFACAQTVTGNLAYWVTRKTGNKRKTGK